MATFHESSGNLVGGGSEVSVGTSKDGLVARTRGLLHGLRALVNGEDAQNAEAAIFLASWCLELTLKGYLAAVGKGKKELQPIQHDLVALWELAQRCGLMVPAVPPRWCQLLSETHNSPFHQRYPTDASVSVAPNLRLVLSELEVLLVRVEQFHLV
jgi:hypothetical protein